MSRAFSLLICLAFTLRSLLPVGFMLAASPTHGGGWQIVVCTGHGPETLTLDEKGTPRPVHSAADKTTCPYAPVGAITADHHAPDPLAHTVQYAAITFAIAAQIFHATPKPGAVSARGPPTALI